MTPSSDMTQNAPASGEGRLRLNEAGLEAAKRSIEKGAVTPSYGPWREDIIKLQHNDAARFSIAGVALVVLIGAIGFSKRKGQAMERRPRYPCIANDAKLTIATANTTHSRMYRGPPSMFRPGLKRK